MNLDELKNMSEDPDLISGIYNYCDRWCERCYLSSRCLTFKMEHHDSNRSRSKDLNNKEFWNDLSNAFDLTLEMLDELAEQQGVYLDDFDKEAEPLRVDDPEIKTHPVTQRAEEYYESASDWLVSYRETFIEKIEGYKDLVLKEINTENNTNKSLVLKDLYEIVSWYHTMILVKSKRAVMGLVEDEYEDEIQNDMNGTAKVVLKSIERSIFAWSGLLKHMPEQEEVALRNLSNLQKLKKSINAYFPYAEQFIRPGFDE